jgi:hypothetical protein
MKFLSEALWLFQHMELVQIITKNFEPKKYNGLMPPVLWWKKFIEKLVMLSLVDIIFSTSEKLDIKKLSVFLMNEKNILLS